jgi:hypothetical protein
LQEYRNAGPLFRIIRSCVHEHANAPNPLALLRARRERPRRRRAAEQRDELATSQLIEWHSISVPRREEQKAEA